MTKKGSWPGWRRLRLAQFEQKHPERIEGWTRQHCWSLLERLYPTDPEYQEALKEIIELDGHPSAKERFR